MNNTVVYIHRRKDTNEVFYVGIGLPSRPYRISNRNRYWTNIFNRHGRTVEIISKNIEYDEALELECLLIKKYGRIDLGTGLLVNMTDGGEGSRNPSQEIRDKISKSRIGVKETKERRLQISRLLIGNKNAKGSVRTEKMKVLYALKSVGNNSRGMKVMDSATGIVYESAKQSFDKLGDIIDCTYESFTRQLRGIRTNKTTLKYL